MTKLVKLVLVMLAVVITFVMVAEARQPLYMKSSCATRNPYYGDGDHIPGCPG